MAALKKMQAIMAAAEEERKVAEEKAWHEAEVQERLKKEIEKKVEEEQHEKE